MKYPISRWGKTFFTAAFLTILVVQVSLSQNRRPNIILIMSDDQGYGDLACHGNPWIKTPNLDQLHSQSLRLTNYHTGTTCSPTRASLMTGQHFNRVGVWHTIMGRSILREGETTLPEVLKQNGYQTAIFGKWHLGDNYPFRPQDRGFNEVLIHGGGGVGQTPDYWNNDYFDDTYFHNGKPQAYKGYCTDVWFSEALKFIEGHQKEPFFCYLPTNAAHHPFHVPDTYRKMYAGQPEVFNPNFYGMITNLDDNVGRLVQKLQQLGLAENTILIFTTDNGTSHGAGAQVGKDGMLTGKGFNAGMRGVKSSPYEGGHRTPFFIRYPAGKLGGGKDVPSLTSCMDIMPTLFELCGIRAGATIRFDGTSVVPLLQNPSVKGPARTIIVDTQREDFLEKWKQSAVMTDRWRLINGNELYDMQQDPGQTRNTAQEFPDTVKVLRESYEEWWHGIEPRKDEYVRIHLGGKENPVTLTCHDVHPDTKEMPAWHQEMVRKGDVASMGKWMVAVEKAGQYEITLRRWPQEAKLPNAGSAPASGPIPGGTPYPAGKAFNWKKANLSIATVTQEKNISPADEATTFRVQLPEGNTSLQAWFTNEKDAKTGAFYVYVKRITTAGK